MIGLILIFREKHALNYLDTEIIDLIVGHNIEQDDLRKTVLLLIFFELN